MKKESKIILAVVVVAVVGFAVAAIAYKRSAEPKSNPTQSDSFVREDSATLGPVDSPVTIVEFLDPECESCKAFYPIMKDVLRTYEGRVRFVVRYMAFHRSSVVAVAATEAAGQQGKYWEMQGHLFGTAEEWGHQETPIKSFFVSYARDLGLDVERFKTDFEDPKWAAKVQRDMADGAKLGVKGTPTIFVNGTRLTDLSQEALESLIEQSLKK
jgi:protein-disulfide isomerase